MLWLRKRRGSLGHEYRPIQQRESEFEDKDHDIAPPVPFESSSTRLMEAAFRNNVPATDGAGTDNLHHRHATQSETPIDASAAAADVAEPDQDHGSDERLFDAANLRYAFPSLCYFASNNINFLVLDAFSPAGFQ